MKFQSNTLLAPISKANVKNLTSIVNETLDVNIHSKKQTKIFSAAELWMIRKQRRTFRTRRFI